LSCIRLSAVSTFPVFTESVLSVTIDVTAKGSSADAAQMATLMRITPHTMHRFALSHNERNRCTQLAINFYRLHIPDFPELKSFDVLRQVYDSE